MSNMCAVLFLFVILVSEIAGADHVKPENPNSKQFMIQDFGQYLLNSTKSGTFSLQWIQRMLEKTLLKALTLIRLNGKLPEMVSNGFQTATSPATTLNTNMSEENAVIVNVASSA